MYLQLLTPVGIVALTRDFKLKIVNSAITSLFIVANCLNDGKVSHYALLILAEWIL